MDSANKIIYQDEETTKFSIISRKFGTFIVVIDTEDVEKIKDYKWNIAYTPKGNLHAVRSSPKFKQKMIYLHKLITGNKFTDHIDGNILNNKKSNISDSDFLSNNKNMKMHKDNRSGYKGVDKINGKYRSRITVNGKTITIGKFGTKEEAAKAYNEYAIKHHGEFARLNEII